MSPLARCTEKSCPVRWRDGDDRPCRDHGDSERTAIADAAAELGIDMTAIPRHRDDERGVTDGGHA